MRSPAHPAPAHRRRGFTMIELLVVIGIIVLLAAILIPVVSQVRMQGYKATTTGEMQRIMTACQNYFHDFNSYPGPLANNQVVGMPAVPPQPVSMTLNSSSQSNGNTANLDPTKITSSENLVLGLLGLLSPTNSASSTNNPIPYTPPPPQHDVLSLNYNHPASYHYIDYIPEELTQGFTFQSFGQTDAHPVQWPMDSQVSGSVNQPKSETVSDTLIPEFQDHIPDPMPILYMRAYTGVPIGQPSAVSGVVTNDEKKAPAQYDFTQLSPYGFNNVSPLDYPTPVNLTIQSSASANLGPEVVTYFLNPNIAGQPRGKDSFILISAGPDRLYGTADDIIVAP